MKRTLNRAELFKTSVVTLILKKLKNIPERIYIFMANSALNKSPQTINFEVTES